MSDVGRLLADRIGLWSRTQAAPLAVGLAGAQGSGKSTVAAATVAVLEERGLRCAVLALDDFYLTRAERARLGHDVHPLLATRGPPGTHDVAQALRALGALKAGGTFHAPVFDKLRDDRLPAGAGRVLGGPFDVILLEGWCVGARPQTDAMLAQPINALEGDEDADGLWRGFVNRALAGAYQTLFTRLDRLVFLQAPGFDVVVRWRSQQEEANARAADPAHRALAMHAAQVARFIQHYERITRWMLFEVPGRADLVIGLDEERRLAGLRGP